jgi:hypothetical protein
MLSRPSAASFRTGDEAPPKSFECSFSSSLALLHTPVVASSSWQSLIDSERSLQPRLRRSWTHPPSSAGERHPSHNLTLCSRSVDATIAGSLFRVGPPLIWMGCALRGAGAEGGAMGRQRRSG